MLAFLQIKVCDSLYHWNDEVATVIRHQQSERIEGFMKALTGLHLKSGKNGWLPLLPSHQ